MKKQKLSVGAGDSTVYAKFVRRNVGADDPVCPFLKRNTQKGITLVALVITIIVLLILAMVSISIVMNQGIMTKSKTASDTHQVAAEKEAINIGYSEYLTKKYNGKTNPTLTVADANAQESENEWTITFANGNVYTLSKDGEIEGPTNNGGGTEEGTTVGWTDNGDGTITKGTTTLSIGDYIAYNEAGTGSYTADTSKGVGRSSKMNMTTNRAELTAGEAYTTENLGWRVLGVNDKGELELISDNPHSEKLCLANEEGYLYGVDKLNRMCNTLYGKGTNSAGKVVATAARSLNVEDINKLANYDPIERENGYGDIWTYRFPTGGNYMQSKRTKENGTLVTDWTDIRGVGYQTFRMPGETKTISRNNKRDDGISVKHTSYSYSISGEITDTSIADIITKVKGIGEGHWLASHFVFCNSNTAKFGMRLVFCGSVRDHDVGYGSLYGCNGIEWGSGYYVRPVVSLKSDIQIDTTNKDGKTAETAYEIK